MYELSRVRLHSVGPKGARYQDVTLDLRDVGAAVARPTQDALYGPAAQSGPVRRPAPATVLFLENGGGKSVLMKLIFSVMLPGRRQVVGTSSTRVLEKFVLAADVSHVALEWQHVTTGQRVVVGKVSAWRDHVISTDPSRLLEAWYSFRPSRVFHLDSLPFTEMGRIVSMRGFRDRFTEAHRAEPEIEAMWETGQRAWTDRLAALGLDPELFAYQRRMNAGEGEAAEAFSFRSDDAFVDWLLTAVTHEDAPRALGEVVDGYAVRLAQRNELMAERDFVAGALDRLVPLAEAAGDAEAAAGLYRDARRNAERFAAALLARRGAETDRMKLLTSQAAQAEIDDRNADKERRRLNDIYLELARLVAELRWKESEEARQRLGEDRDRAVETFEAWRATGVLLRHRGARAEAEEYRRIVAEREEEAAPVLARRDEAARRLARGLLAVAADADTEASRLDTIALDLGPDVEQAEADSQHATRDAERERGTAGVAEGNIASAQEAIQQAVAAELLAAGADVSDSAASARRAAEEASEILANYHTELGILAGRHAQLTTDLTIARREREHLAEVATDTRRTHTAAVSRGEALAAEERLAELLGADEVLLDADTPALLDLLAEALRCAQTEQTDLRIAEQDARRLLEALGDGRLLPPGQDVAAALSVLEAARITAWSGWRYLASVPPDERDRCLAVHPHLVDGIVLNNPDHLDSARDVLSEARLLPRAVVAVGTTEMIADLDAAGPAQVGFVVPPNPAMYDEDKAEQERETIVAAQGVRAAKLGALADRIAADQGLLVRLTDWRQEFPPGALDELAGAADQAEQDLHEAEQRLAERETAVEDNGRAQQDISRALPAAHQAETDAKERARRLAALAEQAVQIPQWQRQARECRERADTCDRDASLHRERAKQLRLQAAEATRKADDHRRVAHSCRDELGRVSGGGAVSDDSPVPVEPVEALRSTYEAAKEAYVKVEVGADLRADLQRVERTEAETRASVEVLKPAIRVLADDLISTPDGSDSASRAAATDRAGRAVDDLTRRHEGRVKEAAWLEADYQNRPRQDVALEPYGRPHDIAHGEELVARARADWEHARAVYDEVHGRKERLDGEVSRTERTVEGFDSHLDGLADVAPVDIEVPPFAGTLDDARSRRTELMGLLVEADAMLAGTEKVVRQRADALARYATEQRFEKVTSPVRRQIITVERDNLPDHAAEWSQALRARLRSLDDDLAQINRHRSTIVTRLHGMVDQAVATLRSAQRLSTLPAGLDDWSGQEFLRIRFATPDRAVLEERLGTVLDDAVAVRSDDRGGGKRDGLTLLLKGVRAATGPKGVRVEMLKPDAVLRSERVRVAEISDVFSGGQLLTAAIILYCTMAALRANERGHTRRPHAGVLFLDNPIGRASAGYLLELQLKVADALGVQLIYTTGLFDTNALSVFPLIVRLRNDADLRAGLKYLSIEQTIAAALAELPDADDTATVTATQLFARPDGATGQAS